MLKKLFETKPKTYYQLNPKEDITPLEAVYISQLFYIMNRPPAEQWGFDMDAFIKEYKLERHFDEVTE